MFRLAFPLIFWSLFLSALVRAEEQVDVELVLAVDVSWSMNEREREIQRRGYAEALRSPQVVKAITGGIHGRIAVAYVEWAGWNSQSIVMDWTIIASEADAVAASQRLLNLPSSAMRRTSISGAIVTAQRMIETNDIVSLRRVIDISGDGPNNAGERVLVARQRAVSSGIVINGLPLMPREGRGSTFSIPDLDRYYANCVIGGPASFVIPVLRWEEFGEAVRRKLVLELANGPDAVVQPVNFHKAVPDTDAPYDCLIGERIWERLRQQWMDE